MTDTVSMKSSASEQPRAPKLPPATCASCWVLLWEHGKMQWGMPGKGEIEDCGGEEGYKKGKGRIQSLAPGLLA